MKALYKRYRPKTLKGLLGQDTAVETLQRLMEEDKLPHAILLEGPSGCGKTTVARILAREMGCDPGDLREMDGADKRGVDDVRDIKRQATIPPLGGGVRVFIMDEAQKMTNDAQNALLKILEDTPSFVYFFICTTDDHKLIKPIHTRCTKVKFGSVDEGAMFKIVDRCVRREKFKVDKTVIDQIVLQAEGSPRKALVFLEQIAHLEGTGKQLDALEGAALNREQAIKLARCLFAKGSQWKVVAAVLKGLEKDDAEGIRYLVLGYARSVLLGGGPMARHAFDVITIFSEPFYNTKNAGLAAACYSVLHPPKG